jgi:hypothetical protein
MKTTHLFFMAVSAISALTAKADWGLDTSTWNTLAPFSDSQMTISDGSATFLNRGILVSQISFPTSIQITGSFEFTGNTDDQFQINLRTDGTLQQPADNFALGTYVSFGGGDIALNTPNNVKVEDDIYSTVSQTEFTFAADTFYNFQIIDNGNSITLYLSDLTTPLLTLNTTDRQGGAVNEIDMENSRGTAGGGPAGENLGVVLDNFSITPIPEPSIICFLGLSTLLLAGRKLKK